MGMAQDDVGLQRITVMVSGPKGNDIIGHTYSVSGTIKDVSAYYFDSSDTNYAGVPGNYYVALWIKDTNGETTNRVFPVTVQESLNDLPVFTWEYPSPADGSDQTGPFTVKGTAWDNNNIQKATIALNDSQTNVNIVVYSNALAPSQSMLIDQVIDPAAYGLTEGPLSIGIWMIDGNGNKGPNNNEHAVAARTIHWSKDRYQPSLLWSGLADGSTHIGSLTVSGIVADQDDLQKVTIALLDLSTQTSTNIVVYTDVSPSASSWWMNETINPAEYGITQGFLDIGIWVVDGAGNKGWTNCECAIAHRTVYWRPTADTAPSFTWTQPAAGSVHAGSFTVSGTVWDNDNVQKVTIALLDNQTNVNVVVYSNAAALSQSISFNQTINLAVYGLNEGILNLGLWMIDGNGNKGLSNCMCAVSSRNIIWSDVPLSEAGSRCIGNNYAQQAPLPNIRIPVLNITNNLSSINERSTILLTASSSVDTSNGGTPFYFWCADRGGFQFDPNYPDYSSVTYIAPFVAQDIPVKIVSQVGDGLGYVDTDTLIFNITDIGNSPMDPPPSVSLATPASLQAGHVYTMSIQISDQDQWGADTTALLVSDLFYIKNGVTYTIATGLKGNINNYAWTPYALSDSYRLKIVTSDGHTQVTDTTSLFTVNPVYRINGTITDLNGNSLENVAVQANGQNTVYSDYTGNYQISSLSAASYTLTVLKPGYTFHPQTISLTPSMPVGVVNF